MPRQLWGEFVEEEKTNDFEKIPLGAKKAKLDDMQTRTPVPGDKTFSIKIRNPLVTQTIEVMQQTEMLQSLIDTYSNKSGSSNYLLNPLQMIPEVNFPPENVAEFDTYDKFAKPIWFVPPRNSRFSRGVPVAYPQINSEVCRMSLRKAVCGQLRVAGYTDTAESALVLFADATEAFVRSFMQHIREVHANDPELETENEIEAKSVEKAYYSLTNTSLTSVHNYFKHNLLARNRAEIAEFNETLQEYDKLMKQSQSMQKDDFQEGDFLGILESNDTMGSTMQDISTANSTVLSVLDGQHTGTFKDVFHSKPADSDMIMHDNGTTDGLHTYTTELLQPNE